MKIRLLLFAICLVSFASCNDGNHQSEESNTAPSETEKPKAKAPTSKVDSILNTI